MDKKHLLKNIGLSFVALFFLVGAYPSYLSLKVWKLDIPKVGDPIPITQYMRLRHEKAQLPLPRKGKWVGLFDAGTILPPALLFAEDRYFYLHNGFDWEQISAAISEWREENKFRGASTITQQLARNLFLSPEISLIRKIDEAILTVALELKFSKDQIFNFYINTVEWGTDAWGVEEAANYYFDIPPSSLTAEQSLFLVSLLASPRADIKPQLERMRSVFQRVSILLPPNQKDLARIKFDSFSGKIILRKPAQEALKVFQ